MNKKPVLVVMAAGMGSRYGGLKQIDPVDPYGNKIMDFSVYDALKAGFEKVVFIIKKDIEDEFKNQIGERMAERVQVDYAFQELDKLPKGFSIPQGRVKPWGTAHAVLCCKDVVDGPFAVINADDYYGQSAFKSIYGQLAKVSDSEKYQYAMVGYKLYNTLTENGYVARGICTMDGAGRLAGIKERTRIEKRGAIAAFTEDGGETFTQLPEETIVSMNMWGFTASIIKEIDIGFETFLNRELSRDPLKCEYFLPFVVDELLKKGKADVTVLQSIDRWYGVTYKEDKKMIVNAIKQRKEAGLYPAKLWEEA